VTRSVEYVSVSETPQVGTSGARISLFVKVTSVKKTEGGGGRGEK
jgi:hypothetical protein